MATVIETIELTKHYGKHQAVRGMNLSVQAGSVCAFLGQNGAGKSSTIKMLLGMIHPTSGSGSIFGHPVCLWRIDTRAEHRNSSVQPRPSGQPKTLALHATGGCIVGKHRPKFVCCPRDCHRFSRHPSDLLTLTGVSAYRSHGGGRLVPDRLRKPLLHTSSRK